MIVAERPIDSEKNLFHCNFALNKFHMEWPRHKPRPVQ
jgi:hypothetical protein